MPWICIFSRRNVCCGCIIFHFVRSSRKRIFIIIGAQILCERAHGFIVYPDYNKEYMHTARSLNINGKFRTLRWALRLGRRKRSIMPEGISNVIAPKRKEICITLIHISMTESLFVFQDERTGASRKRRFWYGTSCLME